MTQSRGELNVKQTDNIIVKEKEYVLIKKGSGKFFCVYNIDAFIFAFLFNYMVLPGIKCGFPDNALNKVLKKLDDLFISYKVFINDKLIKEKDFKDRNDYIKLSVVAKHRANLNDRLDLLIKRIKLSDREILEKVIEVIEECLRL